MVKPTESQDGTVTLRALGRPTVVINPDRDIVTYYPLSGRGEACRAFHEGTFDASVMCRIVRQPIAGPPAPPSPQLSNP